jgi:outer membrane lipoprotein-sorting protein
MKQSIAIGVALMLLGFAASGLARAESAQEILDHIKAVNDARQPADGVQHATMTIVDPGGATRSRELAMFNKREPAGASKSLLFFLGPPDLRNVAVLTWSYRDKDDEQWIYFPETERVRRLSAQIAKDDLGDSDFSYEDSKLFEDLLRDWTKFGSATLVRQGDSVGGVSCTVLDFHPSKADIPYGRLRMWLDRDDSTLRKMELYGHDDVLLKVLTVDGFSEVDKVPTPHRLEMDTVKRGSKTTLELSDVQYNRGLNDALFTQHQMQRGPAEVSSSR